VLAAQRYQLVLEAQRRALAEQAARLDEEIERRREDVVAADQQVRVLDKLRERRQREHRYAAERAEAKRLDEVGANRWKGAPQ
jgi:flagellar FliJ protein